jgi:hypothetical protein
MPVGLTYFSSPADIVPLALAVVLALLLGVIGFRWWKNSRITPEEHERRRRSMLVARGKMGDATVVEMREHHIFYSYDVRGVEYTASQDISALALHLPPDFSAAIGPVLVKYDPRNPANSVIVAEQWSGLRANIAQS